MNSYCFVGHMDVQFALIFHAQHHCLRLRSCLRFLRACAADYIPGQLYHT
jgi:hypothetical protein